MTLNKFLILILEFHTNLSFNVFDSIFRFLDWIVAGLSQILRQKKKRRNGGKVINLLINNRWDVHYMLCCFDLFHSKMLSAKNLTANFRLKLQNRILFYPLIYNQLTQMLRDVNVYLSGYKQYILISEELTTLAYYAGSRYKIWGP